MKVPVDVAPLYDDEQLIEAFLAGEPAARAELPKRFGPGLLRIAARRNDRLARMGLDEDVVQQVYLLLLTRPLGHFDRTRGDGVWGYLKTLTQLAARDLQAQYAPPGTRTRACVSSTINEQVHEKTVVGSLEVSIEDQPATDITDDLALGQVVGEAILDGLGAEAPYWLRRVLGLVIEGLTISEAATAVGQSRYSLRRALRRWAKPAATTATLRNG